MYNTHKEKEILKMDFCEVQEVASSLLNSWAHITQRKDTHKKTDGWGGGGDGAHLKFTLPNEKDTM